MAKVWHGRGYVFQSAIDRERKHQISANPVFRKEGVQVLHCHTKSYPKTQYFVLSDRLKLALRTAPLVLRVYDLWIKALTEKLCWQSTICPGNQLEEQLCLLHISLVSAVAPPIMSKVRWVVFASSMAARKHNTSSSCRECVPTAIHYFVGSFSSTSIACGVWIVILTTENDVCCEMTFLAPTPSQPCWGST